MGGKPRNKWITIGDLRFERRALCGKSAAHWERMAKKHVVEMILRASFQLDENCIPGALARQRLLELAEAESPELMLEVLQERQQCIEGFSAIMADMMGLPK